MSSRRDLFFITALWIFLGISHSGNCATVGFQPALVHQVAADPTGSSLATAIGDFDGDGNADIAVAYSADQASASDGYVSVWIGSENGTFSFGNNFIAGKNPYSIAAADFDGDGNLDLVVSNLGIDHTNGGFLSGSVSVLLGIGNGTFQDHVDYATGLGPNSVAVGDFNGDGRLDFAVKAAADHLINVFLGHGDGTFRPHIDTATGDSGIVGELAVADFNQDGKTDLVVAGAYAGGVVRILLGNGDGTFQPGASFDQAGPFGRSLAAGDLDGDGKIDLVVSHANFGNATASGTSVMLGHGDGTFAHATTLPKTKCHVGTPFIADVDGDGKLDIVTISGGGPLEGFCGFLGLGDVLVFRGNGDGTFKTPDVFNTEYAYNLIAVGDLDGDNAPDLVTMDNIEDSLANTIGVALNITGADFSISTSSSSLGTIRRGQSATTTLSFEHLNNFDEPVAVGCSVQPATTAAPTCSITPSSLSFDGSGHATATLTFSTSATSASLAPSPKVDMDLSGFLCLPLAGMVLIGTSLASGRSAKNRLLVCLSGVVLLSGVLLQTACGGGSNGNGGSQATTYTVTITGMSEATNHSTTMNVIVR